MLSSNLQSNSSSCCLLCLGTENCQLLEGSEETSEAQTAFKMLLRYFKVDMGTKLVHIGDKLCEATLPVSLCEDCSSVANDFLDLYQALEGIRLQLDLCLRQLHGFMEKGEKDPDRVREYQKRVNSGSLEALMDSSILDNLRKEMLKKVSRKLKFSLPRIVVEKSKRKLEGISQVHEPMECSMEEAVPQEDTLSEMVENEPLLATEENGAKTGKEERVCDNISADMTEERQRLKCIPCGKTFPSKSSLERHQFNKHSTLIFKEKSHLPQNMSEYQLESVLRDILRPIKHSVIQCPFCGVTGFESKYKVRPHLLEKHLPEITARVEQIPKVNIVGGDLSLTKKSFWNCVPCGEWFHEKDALLEHQFQNHVIRVLKEEKGNGDMFSVLTVQSHGGEESEGNLLKS